MEQFMTFLTEHVPEIVAYAIIAVCYILYFVIRSKVGKSGKILRTMVKEKIVYIDNENVKMNKKVDDTSTRLLKELNEVKQQIEVLEKTIAQLTKRQKKSEGVIVTMIEEDKKRNE